MHNKSFKRDWAQKAAPNPLTQPLSQKLIMRQIFQNIHFLNYKLLALELSENKIDDSVALKYLILQSILFGSSIKLPLEIVDPNPYSNLSAVIFSDLTFIGCAAISIYGIWYLYRINKSGDGKDFFKRFICLSFPVTIYLILVFFIPLLIFLLWGASLSHQLLAIFELSFAFIILVCFYWLMHKCFEFISSVKNDSAKRDNKPL